MSDYRLLANGTELLDVVVERPAWITGPAVLPAGWLRSAVSRALRRYFASSSVAVFTV